MKPPTTHAYVSLDSTTFAPVDYNRTYYSEVMEDEAALIRWQATTLDKRIKAHLHSTSQRHFTSLREAGSGPAVHHLFALEKYVDTIHLSDFLPANLEEIRRWLDHEEHTHDWRPFVAAILDAEGIEVGDGDIETRQESVRAKIQSLSRIDLKRGTGIGSGYSAPFLRR